MWGNVGVGAQYVCACVCECVVGVGRLTQLPPSLTPTTLGLVRTSHCFQMPSYKHTPEQSHTHNYTNTGPRRQMHTQTHSPKPIPFPEIEYLKLNKNAENKPNLFSCFPLLPCLVTVSRQAFGRSVHLSVVS